MARKENFKERAERWRWRIERLEAEKQEARKIGDLKKTRKEILSLARANNEALEKKKVEEFRQAKTQEVKDPEFEEALARFRITLNAKSRAAIDAQRERMAPLAFREYIHPVLTFAKILRARKAPGHEPKYAIPINFECN